MESEGRVIRQLAQAVHTIQPTWLDILDKMTRAEKMSPADQISVATKMYYMGFLFLPWMWFINYLYFRPVVKTPQASPQLKTSTPPRLQPMSRITCVVSLQRMFCCSCPALPDRLHGLGGCVPRMGDILFFRAREARIVRPPLFHWLHVHACPSGHACPSDRPFADHYGVPCLSTGLGSLSALTDSSELPVLQA